MAKHVHAWETWWVFNRPLCTRCGMLWLRNDVSDRDARRPCPGKD